MARAEPANNSIASGHLLMPKVPEEPVCLAREHPHPGRAGSSSPWFVTGIQLRDGKRTFFVPVVARPKGYLGIPTAALLSLQCQTQNRQCHSLQGCCLHWATPSCCWGSWQSAWSPERLCPCQGNASGQLLTQQHFWAVLTYHIPVPGGLAPSPSTSVAIYSWKTS